jgi:hypothetical protein
MLARSSPWNLFTARITAVQNTRNCIVVRVRAGAEQVVAEVVAHRPVQVLA